MTKKSISVMKNIFTLPRIPKNEDPTNSQKYSVPADFETAILATGFGKYNFLLISIGIMSGWSSIFETTTMSYVFPAAQCDLDLSLSDKGLLNGITYFGMISSALIWGFLSDTLGRKKLLTVGYGLDAFFVIMSSFSQNKIFLMIAKFLGGFIINGPFATFISYLSEFQCAQHRARMQLVMGTIYACGNIAMPLLAWGIMPENLDFHLGFLRVHSWNIYLLICAIPSILSFVFFVFMPESPKFLMTIGQNEKALHVFRKVYSINSGKPMDTYPITELIDELNTKEGNVDAEKQTVTKRSKSQAMREGFGQMKPLFFRPHLWNMILTCSLQLLFTMSLNTLRLWLPQIFQAMNDYKHYNDGQDASICTMIEMIQPQNTTEICQVNLNNSSVYINSIIVAGVCVCSYPFAGYFINILGKKKLLCIFGLISGSAAMSIYFTNSSALTIACFSIFHASASIATNVVLAVIVDLFPTTLRTMTLSLAMMLARAGAMLGNLTFPLLLEAGCAPPFFTVGSIILSCAFLTLLLPNTDLKALE